MDTSFDILSLIWNAMLLGVEVVVIIPMFWGFMGVGPELFYEVYADIGTILAAIIGLYYYLRWPAD